MQNILAILTISLFSTALAVAQDNPRLSDDHSFDDLDLGAPIQVGYAVITPLAATTSGLVAFETFGFKHGPDTAETGILPSDPTTSAVLFVDSNGELARNLGVAIVNPATADATVTLTLRQADGTTLATKVVTVGSHHQISEFFTQLFADRASVPRNLTGTLAITSNTPVGIAGLRSRGVNFSAIPVTSRSPASEVPIIANGIGGAGAILLPQFAAGGGWSSEIVIANLGTTSVTVRMDLFKQDGLALSATLNHTSASSFSDITIPAGGVITLAPRDVRGNSQ